MEEWEEILLPLCLHLLLSFVYTILRLIREIHVILSMVCSIHVYAKILVK